jgi:hypothetical protein
MNQKTSSTKERWANKFCVNFVLKDEGQAKDFGKRIVTRQNCENQATFT